MLIHEIGAVESKSMSRQGTWSRWTIKVVTQVGSLFSRTTRGRWFPSSSSSVSFFESFLDDEGTKDRTGAKKEHCATRVPHRYNVLGTFHVTDSWSERVKGKTVCRVRFDMLDLKASSWWGVKGSPSPTQKPDYKTKALVKTCSACGTSSKQRYAPGWMCSNDKCAEFSTINRQAVIEPPAFNQVFIDERNRWPRHIKAPFPLKPAPPTTFLNNPEMGTSLSAWKGMVCPDCHRCNSRSEWDEWKCGTEGCTYEIPIHHTVRTAKALASEHAFEAEGHTMSFDKWEEPVERTKIEFHGYWRKATYELFPGNFITHYFANQQINRQPGGADEALEALQGTKMGLKRHPLENSPGKSLNDRFVPTVLTQSSGRRNVDEALRNQLCVFHPAPQMNSIK